MGSETDSLTTSPGILMVYAPVSAVSAVSRYPPYGWRSG